MKTHDLLVQINHECPFVTDPMALDEPSFKL